MIAPRQTRITGRGITIRLLLVGLFLAVLAEYPALKNPISRQLSRLTSGGKTAELVEAFSTGTRQVFPLSVIRGGAYNTEELTRARRSDPIIGAHYADFGPAPVFKKTTRDQFLYVSYRRNDRVYWSKTRHLVRQGETVITDGVATARARCGNRLSAIPQSPVAPGKGPAEEFLNTPEGPEELVSYKVADLPGPAGRPFAMALPAPFDSVPEAAGSPVHGVGGGLPGGGAASPGNFPFGQGSFGGVGGGPVATNRGQTTATVPSTPVSAGSGTTVNGVAVGGNTLPVAPNYPVNGTVPVETVTEVAPEPSALLLTGPILFLGFLKRSRSWSFYSFLRD